MHILLFIGYSLLCIYGIIKSPFVRKTNIRPAILILFFGLHVSTGLLHNIVAYRYYPEHGDIWTNYQWSFVYRHRLLSDFSLFLENNATLTYFTHNGIIAIQMILNIFSLDSLTVNTLLFSFPLFLGNIALFRLFRRRFPNAHLSAFAIFLLPSTLFWTSCIHREGMLYMLLGFLLYSFDRLLTRHRLGAQRLTRDHPGTSSLHTHRPRTHIGICFISFILILYFRFSIALSLLPALAAWWLAERSFPRRRLLALTGLGLLLLVLLILALPGFFQSLAAGISFRQKEFSDLEGHSRLPLPIMDGTWASIGKVLPAAIRNGCFEPLPGNGGQKIYLIFSLELLFIWGIIATALIRSFIQTRRPAALTQPNLSSPFILFCLTFSLSGLLLIGAIVPFAGAIVRYRSIFLPFLLAPALYGLRTTPFLGKIDTWLTRRLINTGEPASSH
jgi:hypothetical protein